MRHNTLGKVPLLHANDWLLAFMLWMTVASKSLENNWCAQVCLSSTCQTASSSHSEAGVQVQLTAAVTVVSLPQFVSNHARSAAELKTPTVWWDLLCTELLFYQHPLLGGINLLRHQVGDQIIQGDHLSTNPKSNTKIYSLMRSFGVWRSIFSLLFISPCWLLLYQHPQWETFPLFHIAALLKWLFFYNFLKSSKGRVLHVFLPTWHCFLTENLENLSWKETM